MKKINIEFNKVRFWGFGYLIVVVFLKFLEFIMFIILKLAICWMDVWIFFDVLR